MPRRAYRRRGYGHTRRPTEWAYFGFQHELGSSTKQEGIADVITHTTGTDSGDVDLPLEQGYRSSEGRITKLHANFLGVFGYVPGDLTSNPALAMRAILKPYTILRFIGTLSVYVEDGGNTGDFFFNHAFGCAKQQQLGRTDAFRAYYSGQTPATRIAWESFPTYTLRPAGTQSNQVIPPLMIDSKVKVRCDRLDTPFLSSTLLVNNAGTGTDQINVRFAGKCLVSRDLG